MCLGCPGVATANLPPSPTCLACSLHSIEKIRLLFSKNRHLLLEHWGLLVLLIVHKICARALRTCVIYHGDPSDALHSWSLHSGPVPAHREQME